MNDGAVVARRLLKLQFASRFPPRDKFVWPNPSDLLRAQKHLCRDLFQAEGGSIQYQKTFAKVLLSKLEIAIEEVQIDDDGEEYEVDGAIVEHYASLMAASSQRDLSQTVTYYYPGTNRSEQGDGVFTGWNSVRLEEEVSTITRGTTGLKTWEASLSLASHLVAHANSIFRPGVRILELGSGAGLLGALCGQLKQDGRVLLTDLEGQVLDRLRATIDKSVSFFPSCLRCCRVLTVDHSSDCCSQLDMMQVQGLDWRDIDRDLLASFKPDIILAADVVYDPDLCEPLACTLKTALEVGSAEVHALLASTVRNDETYQIFMKALGELFSIYIDNLMLK